MYEFFRSNIHRQKLSLGCLSKTTDYNNNKMKEKKMREKGFLQMKHTEEEMELGL